MDAEFERVGDVRLDREQDGLALGGRIDLLEAQDRAADRRSPSRCGDELVGPRQPDRRLAVGDRPAEALGIEPVERQARIEEDGRVDPGVVEQPGRASRRP